MCVDVDHLACAGERVVAEDGVGDGLVGGKTAMGGLDSVVFALGEICAIEVAATRLVGWAGDQVVDGSALGAGPAGTEAINQDWIRDVHMDEGGRGELEALEDLIEVGGLFDRARIAVDEEAVVAIGLGETRFEKVVHHFIGYKTTLSQKAVDELALM